MCICMNVYACVCLCVHHQPQWKELESLDEAAVFCDNVRDTPPAGMPRPRPSLVRGG
jgi:hypothetical protein